MRSLGDGKATNKELTQVVESLRHQFKLEDLLEFIGLNRKTFYYNRARLNYDKYSEVKDLIKWLYAGSDETYGYRRIQDELFLFGYVFDDETVRRIMRSIKLMPTCYWTKSGKFSSYKGEHGKVAENLVRRDYVVTSGRKSKFVVTQPYTVLTTDVTQINLLGTKLYLAAIIDMYSKEILAYDIRTSPNMAQVTACVDQLQQVLPDGVQPILHSDQGTLYQLPRYQNRLDEVGLIQSMSRKGNCLDNAPMESFFSLAKREFIWRKEFVSIDQFKESFSRYVSRFNNVRISRKNKGLTPVEIRNQALAA
nr:IS3 family transposase [Periweissella cryptocerci]